WGAAARPPASAARRAVLQPVGFKPLSSKRAAKFVHRSKFEPRPANRRPNHHWPTPGSLRSWRQRSDMPYAKYVNGHFKGTTDEIIQWAAYKWGLDADMMRAAAVVESWWRQSTIGDNGDSFGLFQVRRPFHCFGRCTTARRSTAFNADYYGGIIRALYDGRMGWLNNVQHGRTYAAGDIWGSVGTWFAGKWWTRDAASYISRVQ